MEWTYALYGRDGADMSGVHPVSNREIEAFARLRCLSLDPVDVEALVALNAALCYPDDATGSAAEQEKEQHVPDIPTWKPRPEGVEPQFVVDEDE